MWRSVFLHEFIDHHIANFQAVAGNATPESLALAPSRDVASGINAVKITPGKGFEYVLEEQLNQVIGFSCRVRLSYPISPDVFLEPFTEFLRIIHATLPNGFEQLAAEIGAVDIVPEECKALLEAALEQNTQALDPVITLLAAAAERVREIAGGS